MNIEELALALQKSLLAHEEILAVYLFGSYAEECARPKSDLDIAILLRPNFEPSLDYRLNLLEELSDSLPYRLDLIILNQVPPLVQFQVLQKGRVLLDRDPSARAELVMHMLNRYYDTRRYYEFHFGHLIQKIKERGLGDGHPRHPSQAQEAR